MSGQLNVIYRIADGGPFHLEVENGVTIENITDDLVNAGILVPITEPLMTRAEWEASIEKCEHGNCVSHFIVKEGRDIPGEIDRVVGWCPGPVVNAAIKEDS